MYDLKEGSAQGRMPGAGSVRVVHNFAIQAAAAELMMKLPEGAVPDGLGGYSIDEEHNRMAAEAEAAWESAHSR